MGGKHAFFEATGFTSGRQKEMVGGYLTPRKSQGNRERTVLRGGGTLIL